MRGGIACLSRILLLGYLAAVLCVCVCVYVCVSCVKIQEVVEAIKQDMVRCAREAGLKSFEQVRPRPNLITSQ